MVCDRTNGVGPLRAAPGESWKELCLNHMPDLIHELSDVGRKTASIQSPWSGGKQALKLSDADDWRSPEMRSKIIGND